MKAKTAKITTENVMIQNLLARMPNVFQNLTNVTERMIVETTLMSSIVMPLTALVQTMNSNARVCLQFTIRNVFPMIWFVTRKKIAQMVLMNHCIVELMNVPESKTMDVTTNVLIQRKVSNVNVMKATD